MYGYILVAIGLYLIGEDIVKERRAKNAKLLENGNVRSSGDSDSKPRANGKESDRNGRVTPFPVENKGVKNDISQKSVQPVGINQAGSSAGDDSISQPDPASKRGQTEGIKELHKHLINRGGNDGAEINTENGTGNDGDNVDLESSGVNESDSSKTD